MQKNQRTYCSATVFIIEVYRLFELPDSKIDIEWLIWGKLEEKYKNKLVFVVCWKNMENCGVDEVTD